MKARMLRIVGTWLFVSMAAGAGAVQAADLVLYGDSVNAGWQDASWSASINLANANPVHGGTHSTAVTVAAWGALRFARADWGSISSTGYDTLQFWIHGGAAGGQQLQVSINGDSTEVTVTAVAGVWTQVKIPLTDLASPAQIGAIAWWNGSGNSLPVFYVDDVALINQGLPPPPPPPTLSGPALHIDTGAGRHPISDGIYGMNFAEEALATELHLPIRRWGGNSTSRYNWQVGITNTGSDWYYENVPDDVVVADLPNGTSTDLFVEQDKRSGTRSLLTVPLIGWVAKSSSPRNHPYDCGFKVSKYGAQIDPSGNYDPVDSWDTDCGFGDHTNGTPITGNDPTDTSMTITPAFVTGWINHLIGRYGTAANGGVAYYNFDNETALWNSTHRDVHPQPTTYDELRDKTYQYGAAVKAADPGAKTLGPVSWGWCEYLYSAADNCGQGPDVDYHAHNSTPFVAWYLQQMQAYEQQHGVRILDYLDLHAYPQGNGIFSSGAGSAVTQALRLRSTRSLWDPTYVDESWIGTAMRLIPRMKEWVSANYPGTGTAITEYSWGAMGHINGALAQADVLGIFGREGLDIATLWGPPTSSQPGAFAFRMYRNYDGAGHQFGETSVSATSDNQEQLAVYAAQRTGDGALTVTVVNKSANGRDSTISLAGFAPTAVASVYRYSSASLSSIQHLADQAVTASGFSTTFPANSITLFVLPSSVAPPSAPTLVRLVPAKNSMKLIFTAPAGQTPSGYTATCTGGGVAHTQDGATSPITVGNLSNRVSYACSVHARNAGGSSGESVLLTKVVKRSAGLAPLQMLLD